MAHLQTVGPAWLTQFRADAETLKDEDLNVEPEAW
jgi:hypothetical protein